MARLALTWFVLSLGVAVAAPLLQTQDYLVVCSSNGMYQLLRDSEQVNDHDATQRPGSTLKCPLCIPLDAPPDLLGQPRQTLILSAACAIRQIQTASPLSTLCAAPLPARGPPGHSLRA